MIDRLAAITIAATDKIASRVARWKVEKLESYWLVRFGPAIRRSHYSINRLGIPFTRLAKSERVPVAAHLSYKLTAASSPIRV